MCQRRRDAASNVFYNHETLAIDYAIKSSKPKKWYQKLPHHWGRHDKKDLTESPGIYDLEVVKLHMPTLLGRRNASENIVQVTPEVVHQEYEVLTQPSPTVISSSTATGLKN